MSKADMPVGVSNSFKRYAQALLSKKMSWKAHAFYRGTVKKYSSMRAWIVATMPIALKRIRMSATGSVIEGKFGLLSEEENILDNVGAST